LLLVNIGDGNAYNTLVYWWPAESYPILVVLVPVKMGQSHKGYRRKTTTILRLQLLAAIVAMVVAVVVSLGVVTSGMSIFSGTSGD
jgi:hypothetical protein